MIEVKDLTFSYGKDKQALHGLDFTVEDGEIFGFLGPNGSGKSTTQKILTGILKGHGGKVSLFGQDISAAHTQEFFQKIGVLFEFPYLYANLSAVDNLKYFSSFYPKEQIRSIEEVLEELEFKHICFDRNINICAGGVCHGGTGKNGKKLDTAARGHDDHPLRAQRSKPGILPGFHPFCTPVKKCGYLTRFLIFAAI